LTEGLNLDAHPKAAQLALDEIKRLEHDGYVFEGAEATSTLIILKHMGQLEEYFDSSAIEHRWSTAPRGQLQRGHGERFTWAARLTWPSARAWAPSTPWTAPCEAIKEFYPEIDTIVLTDYRVRIINAGAPPMRRCAFTLKAPTGPRKPPGAR